MSGGEAKLLGRWGEALAAAEQLAQTLNRLQHAESVSEGALKTYQENFTAEANYRQLMAIYSKAMQKSGERNEPSCG